MCIRDSLLAVEKEQSENLASGTPLDCRHDVATRSDEMFMMLDQTKVRSTERCSWNVHSIDHICQISSCLQGHDENSPTQTKMISQIVVIQLMKGHGAPEHERPGECEQGSRGTGSTGSSGRPIATAGSVRGAGVANDPPFPLAATFRSTLPRRG